MRTARKVESNRVKVELGIFLIGLVMALIGLMSSGCDGAEGQASDEGGAGGAVGALKHTDGGSVYCDVPSPTGDVVDQTTGRTAREDAMRAAESGTFVSFVVVEDADFGSMCARAAGGSCADAAHDLVDARGLKHCFELSAPGGGTCRPSRDGSRPCQVSSVGQLSEVATSPRASALCTTTGRFVGWWCTT
jgi:hypothetical protein